MLGAVDAGVDGVVGTTDDASFRYLDKQHRYLYLNGQAVGDVGNDGDTHLDYAQQLQQASTSQDRASQYKNWRPIASADFDQNYQPITSSYPSLTSSTYTAAAGDNLYLIAARVWGDSSLWYLLADANGLNASVALTAGQVLTIPNRVTNVHNSSSTFRPYEAGLIMGDTSPTLPTAPPPPPPPRGKHGCSGASILIAIVVVVATIFTAGAAAVAFAAEGAAAMGSAWAAGTAALSGGFGTIGLAAAAVGGAVGSAAGQLVGMGLGVQDKFSWSAVASGALSSMATAYIGGSNLGSSGGTTGRLMATAAAGNVATQGINMLTGQQAHFSWSSVAVSAIAAPIANSLNNELFGKVDQTQGGLRIGGSLGLTNQTGKILAESTSTALVAATTRLVNHGGKMNWEAVAADALSSFVSARMSRGGAIQGADAGSAAKNTEPPGSKGGSQNSQSDDPLGDFIKAREQKLSSISTSTNVTVDNRVEMTAPNPGRATGGGSFQPTPFVEGTNAAGGEHWSSGADTYPIADNKLAWRELPELVQDGSPTIANAIAQGIYPGQEAGGLFDGVRGNDLSVFEKPSIAYRAGQVARFLWDVSPRGAAQDYIHETVNGNPLGAMLALGSIGLPEARVEGGAERALLRTESGVANSALVDSEVSALQRIAANNRVDGNSSAARMARIDELVSTNYNRILRNDLANQDYVYRLVQSKDLKYYDAAGSISGPRGAPTYFSLDTAPTLGEHMLGAQMKPGAYDTLLRIPTSELVGVSVPRPFGYPQPGVPRPTFGREYFTNSYPQYGSGGFRQFEATTRSYSPSWIVK